MTSDRAMRRRLGLGLAGAALVATSFAGTAGAQSPSPEPTPVPTIAPAADPALAMPEGLPAPEQATIIVGYRLPNLNSRAPFLVALDRGYFAEAGLTVELIQTEETLPGVVGGSLQIGNVETLDAAVAFSEGLPIVSVGGYQNYQANIIALRSEITSPADLAGKDILLGGTPGSLDYDYRVGLLKDAGFDLEGVMVNPVTVEGGSNAWVELFLNGQLQMTPVFNRHRAMVLDAGHKLVVDRFDYGSDLLVANKDWAAANPNTLLAFQVAYIRAMADVANPANDAYVFSLGVREGITISPGVMSGWANDVRNFTNHDGGWGDPAEGAGLGELTAYLEANLETPIDIPSFLAWQSVNAAQAALGLAPNPNP